MNKLFERALTQYGVKEISGQEHEPQVLKYFDEAGHSWVDDDETPWCSAFINWCCMKEGLPMSEKLNARSWLDVGDPVDIKDAKIGDIVIFWRMSPHSLYGHVALYANEINGNIFVLGGNQKNSVCIQGYDKGRLLGVRRVG